MVEIQAETDINQNGTGERHKQTDNKLWKPGRRFFHTLKINEQDRHKKAVTYKEPEKKGKT